MGPGWRSPLSHPGQTAPVGKTDFVKQNLKTYPDQQLISGQTRQQLQNVHNHHKPTIIVLCFCCCLCADIFPDSAMSIENSVDYLFLLGNASQMQCSVPIFICDFSRSTVVYQFRHHFKVFNNNSQMQWRLQQNVKAMFSLCKDSGRSFV